MDKLMRMAQSVALFRSAHIKSSLNVPADSGSYRVLILVHNFDGGKGIRPNQVAEYFRCTRPYVSKIVKTLVRRGRVATRPDAQDGRSHRLVCTAAGRAVVETIMEEYLQVTRKLFDGLGEEKSARLVELLEEATRILEDEKPWEGNNEDPDRRCLRKPGQGTDQGRRARGACRDGRRPGH